MKIQPMNDALRKYCLFTSANDLFFSSGKETSIYQLAQKRKGRKSVSDEEDDERAA